MISKKHFWTVFALLLWVGMLLYPLRVFALSEELHISQTSQQELAPATCSNLDVVFIIDQSETMNGQDFANDPYNQRVNAVKNMIDYMIDLAWDRCPGSFHRVAVISFGRKGKMSVDLPLTDIHVSNADDALFLRDSLKKKIRAYNWGWAYARDAFVEASKMLDNAPVAPDPRKRAVIFITDGYPTLTQDEYRKHDYEKGLKDLNLLVDREFPFADSLRERERCLDQLRGTYPPSGIPAEKVTTCLEQHPVSAQEYASSTYVFTLLIRDLGGTQSLYYNGLLEEISSGRGKRYSISQNGQDIPSTLRQIISQLSGVQATPFNCGTFAVNPYLERIVINAYKVSPEVKVTLSYRDASGIEHKIQNGKIDGEFDPNIEYYGEGANERYSIAYPYPGLWSIASTASRCEDIDVYYDEISITPKQYPPFDHLLAFDNPPYYNPDAPQYVMYQLIDKSKGLVIAPSEKSVFAIDAVVKVTEPSGETSIYSLEWRPLEQKFVSTEPIRVPLSGKYRLQVIGKSHRHDGPPHVESANEAEVFDQEYVIFDVDSEFTGVSGTEMRIEAINPAQNSRIGPIHETILKGWKLKALPLKVQVNLVDQDGKLLNPDEVFPDPNDALVAYIKAETPASPSSTEEMVFSPKVILRASAQKPGEFIGDIPSEMEGQQTLIVEVKEDAYQQALSRKYWTYQRVTEIPFVRADCLFCREETYYALLAMTVIAIVGVVVYNISIRTNKVAGTLVFVDGPTRIAEFGLYNGKNFRVIKGRELSFYPQLDLKWARVQNATKRRNHKMQADETFGWETDVTPAVRVDCVSRSGRKFSIDLYESTPTIYSEETMAQMVYEPLSK